MSSSTVSKPYDLIFDSQKHYRTLLNCTARPGTVGLLEDVQMEMPSQLNRATVLAALAVFSGDASFYLESEADIVVRFLSHKTRAFLATARQADFLILEGRDAAAALEALRVAKSGTLLDPELSATVLLQVQAISPAPLADSLELTLTGPGIQTTSTVFVSGIDVRLLEVLQNRNREFPVGIDMFLTCDSLSAGPCVLALPRTTNLRW
jgi:alpha-D-ribose 1-methylphosphonate 5-triphosphate synthase subunit PhnH